MSDAIMESPKKIESKHGLAFDLILENPKCPTPSKLTSNNTPSKIMSAEDILRKLQLAEERRQSIEQKKFSELIEEKKKHEDAAKWREERNVEFIKRTEQKLAFKMDSNKENKTAQLNLLLEKLKKTDVKIARIKELSAKTAQDLEDKINSKLLVAAENRSEKIQAIQTQAQEHDKHIEEVRSATKCVHEELEEKIEEKLQHALEYRNVQREKLMEKIREHEKHANEVREQKAARQNSPPTSPSKNVE